MAKTKGVKFIDSQKLSDAANIINNSIADYNNIIIKISNATTELLDTWYGQGRTEFEKDYTTIYQQLKDISDIMYELYNAILEADSIYIKTDDKISKGMSMKG